MSRSSCRHRCAEVAERAPYVRVGKYALSECTPRLCSKTLESVRCYRNDNLGVMKYIECMVACDGIRGGQTHTRLASTRCQATESSTCSLDECRIPAATSTGRWRASASGRTSEGEARKGAALLTWGPGSFGAAGATWAGVPLSCGSTPNLLTTITPTEIPWLKLSRKFPIGLRTPNPLKPRILVRRLAVDGQRDARGDTCGQPPAPCPTDGDWEASGFVGEG